MPKTAFVTGAAGFLGINLIGALTKQNWKVVAFDLPSADLKYLNQYEVTLVRGNLSDARLLCRAIPEGTDAAFHLAGNTSAWAKNNAQQYIDNVDGTRNMVDAAIEKSVRRFVFTSSISAYGYHPNECINEQTVSNAPTCGMQYHKTKFMAENSIKDAVKKGLNAVILNPCNIIGPYDTHNWTRQLIMPICDGKLQAAPPGKAMWAHVKDIVDAHINAVDNGVAGESYLLGGIDAPFIDVVNEIERLLGKPETDRMHPPWLLKLMTGVFFLKSKIDGEEPLLTPEKYSRAVAHIYCDFSKATSVLGYRTSPLNVMIKDTLTWLKTENLLGST
jgi:dihydroflavonol-4-reductase